MNFKDMKIGSRLSVAFGLVLVIAILSALVTLSKVADIQNNLRDIVEDNNVKIRLNNEMSDSTHIIARVMRTVVLLKEKDLKEQERQKIVKAREAYNKSWAELEKMPASEEGKALRKKIFDARAEAGALNNKVIELGMADKEAEATALLLKEAGPATQRMQDALKENVELLQKDTEKVYAEAEAEYSTTRTLLISANAFVVFLAALSGWLVTRSIVQPLRLAVQAADDVAIGKLDGKLPAAANDETGQLSNATQQNASASEELAATSEELSGQAKQLQDSIAFFNVGERSGVATPVRAILPERRATATARTPLLKSASVRSDSGSNFKPY